MSPFLDEQALQEHRRQNSVHTGLLIAGMVAVVAVPALLVLGVTGLGWAAVLLGVMLVLVPRLPPEVLMGMYRARRIDPAQGNQLNEALDILTARAKLPTRPSLWIIPSMTLNAFAAGRPNHAVIAITEGLLRRLDTREIIAVLAHEMSHIRNNDLWVMGIADVLTRIAQALAYVAIVLAVMNVFAALQGEQAASWLAIALLYLAPTLSSLLQLGLSRAREYDADLEAAQLTGDPLGLVSALQRLEHRTGSFWEDMMPPVPGRRVAYPSLLRSHPATEDRVKRLIEISAQPLPPRLEFADRPMISLVGFGPISMRPRYRFPGFWY